MSGSRHYRDEGVVLRTHKLGEADRIITLLTRQHGKVRAVAKGVRRTASKFGARLEPFMVVDVQLYEGRSLDIVTQAGAALDQVLLDNVYETLLVATDTGEIAAGLTEVPEVSEDGLVYTFTVPEGVTFHNGDALTALDIVCSIEGFRAPTGSGAEQLTAIFLTQLAPSTTYPLRSELRQLVYQALID